MSLGNTACILVVLVSLTTSAKVYNVTDFGADSTGKIASTSAITKAIDKAANCYGGVVRFTKGQYLSGPFELKSNITLQFDDDVVLKFLSDPKEYPRFTEVLPSGQAFSLPFTPLIRAFFVRNVAIRGNGVLDGNGVPWWKRLPPPNTRPKFLFFYQSYNLTLEGVTVRNSPMYNIQLMYTDHVLLKGISIKNPPNYVDPGPNTDGINCNPCRYLHVTNVTVDTGDDCVVLKADVGDKRMGKWPTEHVLIENSTMLAGHGGVSIGSETTAGLRNITVRNCIFNGTNRALYIKTNRGRGGTVEDIHYHNITMLNIRKEGVAIAAIYSGTDEGLHPINDTTPFIRKIRYHGIRGNSKLESLFIVGLPELQITNVILDDFHVQSKKGIFLNQTQHIVINGKEQ
nr:unnamed protein product [Callosobruchus analis]